MIRFCLGDADDNLIAVDGDCDDDSGCIDINLIASADDTGCDDNDSSLIADDVARTKVWAG